MNTAFFEFLAARRSVKPDRLAAPAPTAEELNKILTVGTRVPDHKKLSPWRFIVFEGDARASAGEIFAKACEKEEREPPSHVRLDMERARFMRSPMVIAVISSVKPRPGAPEWEQVLSVGALCFNLCLAANALGFGTSWLSEWIAYSPTVREAFGLTEHEKIAGFIYVGTPMEKPEERDRPKLEAIVKHWPD
ncbi:nitroreductase [Hyphomicrobium sp. MC1]|uniref:nitroreductase family protein n=1 Tax=Hyphomicrobium sp. (strain MC1) TaxID=717785 RepID=UPI000213D5C7|nr:nitroreductase [Hyphomicrobium sp. MC1]CCB65639.1 Nitroreductase family protein [Hyphomicrobium sp. MC1]